MTSLRDLRFPTPDPTIATVAVSAPELGDGFWAGGPSAAVDDDGTVWLACRLRRPVGEGRGYAVVIAHSDDGAHFEERLRLERDEFRCDSLERPTLVRRPDGGWRLYLSLATPDTLHWRVVALDADRPSDFAAADVVEVLDGGPDLAYKDPVVRPGADGWEMWVCLHMVADPGVADAMTTVHATSSDGIDWNLTGTALAPTSTSTWDRRGTRIAAVTDVGPSQIAFYDGRADASENWEERTGVAVLGDDGTFVPAGDEPFATSPEGSGSLRYVDAIEVAEGMRLYYEAAAADGSHHLLTQLVARPTG